MTKLNSIDQALLQAEVDDINAMIEQKEYFTGLLERDQVSKDLTKQAINLLTKMIGESRLMINSLKTGERYL